MKIDNQCEISEELESFEIPDSDGARVSKYSPGGKLVCYLYEDSKTLIDVLERGCRKSDNGRCVAWRSPNSGYSWLNYREFLEKSQNFGSGLVSLGITPGQSTTIGIYAKNSVEWLIAQYGCFYQSTLIIPLYDTLGPDACTFMVNHGGTSVIICDTEAKVQSLLRRKSETPCLKHIIVTVNVSSETKFLSHEKGVELHLFKDIEDLGKRHPAPPLLPKPTDVAIVCYTSGTTGDPKGAMLTHQNIIAAVTGLLLRMGEIKFSPNDIMISYLPLAHIMEQMCEVSIFLYGGSVGFYHGDISQLIDDMKILKPTFFPAVPRLLNKLYDQAMSQVGRENCQLEIPLGIQENDSDMKIEENEKQFDPAQFKTFYDSLGGRLRVILTGAAPIMPKVLTFYNKAMNCEVIEVYGQTECAGPCTANVVSSDSVGNVGPPFACVMIKLKDVPDLGYTKSNQSGEILVKGYSVFQGYLRDPQKTEEALDNEGWLHTGDIAKWLPNGTLKLVDRKKHIFKLSQGEYVAPEKIENIYLQSPYISQILVYGDSLQSYLVAIVVPDKEAIMSRCKENRTEESWGDVCKDPFVRQLIFNDMRRIAKETKLISFEQVKDIHLHPIPFSFEDGQLTPTMKTKRTICKKQFIKQIQAMYGIRDS